MVAHFTEKFETLAFSNRTRERFEHSIEISHYTGKFATLAVPNQILEDWLVSTAKKIMFAFGRLKFLPNQFLIDHFFFKLNILLILSEHELCLMSDEWLTFISEWKLITCAGYSVFYTENWFFRFIWITASINERLNILKVYQGNNGK